ncbi:unnamed protein product [Sphagnum jensenii]|uniref:Uncharacterized protein n=1 Tax=Sphagnum jensenii TaxID=128206 RepID=A0ABP1BTF1_9BRYO
MASSITIGQAMANVSPVCFTRLKNVDSLLLLREQVRRSSRQSCFALVGFIKCANVSIIRTPPRRRPRSSGEKFDVCLVSRARNAVISSSSSELEQDMERAGLEGGKKQLLLGLQGVNEDDIAGERKPRAAAAAAAALVSLSAFSCLTTTGGASAMDIVNVSANPAYGEVGALLEVSVQFIYLGALLALLGVGSFLVVRQVLIRRELESAAKELQDRVRSGEASSEEYFELGAVMLRKKFYVLANKYLEQAIKKWDGDEQDLAQVYNALGFSYFSDDKLDAGIAQYEKAVKLQPGYVTAWNNLADAYEKKKDFQRALKAYEEALQFDPSNKVANSRRSIVKERVERYEGIPSKLD